MFKKTKIAVAVMGVGLTASAVYADGVPGHSMSHNPAFNVVLEGRYVDQDHTHFALPGFQATEAFEHYGTFPSGFSTGHNEINMGADITPDTSGVLSFSIEYHDGETAVDLEEAYVDTKALGKGFWIKAGHYYSHIGNLNRVHEHRQDFANQSLVYLGMFGGHLADTGAQLRWEQEGGLNLKLGAEVSTGAEYPGGENIDNNNGMALFAKIGGDIGSKSSWNGGLSYYTSEFDERRSVAHDAVANESYATENGSVDVTGVDLEYFFSPNGKGEKGELKISAEYFMKDEDGEGAFTNAAGIATANYTGEQVGYYVAAVYRFIPKWRVGVRFDHLEADNKFSNFDAGASGITEDEFLDESGMISTHDPERTTVMVDYAPNSNSVIRLQYMKDDVEEESEDRIYLQYVVAIGGHGH
ncbi:outer membrane beta-barrel protein [Kaarinaea lacus]